MHADPASDRELARLVHAVLDAESGPDPTWAHSPAARRVTEQARTRPRRWPLRLLAVAAMLGLGGAVAAGLIAGRPTDQVAGIRNGWVAFSRFDQAGIHLVREGVAAFPITPVAKGSDVEACPAFSADGRRLAYGRASGSQDVGYHDASLVVADLDADGSVIGSRALPLDGVTIPPCATWSSDGRRIAFGVKTGPPESDAQRVGEPWPGKGDEVWVVDLDTMTIRRLAGLEVTDLEWSPDAAQLAIAADGIARYSVATDDVVPVGTATGVVALSWSPDGERLAFNRNTGRVEDDENEQLWIEDADGTHTHLVAGYRAFHGIGPVWSPDGSRIVYQVSCALPDDDPKPCREGHNAVLVSVETDGLEVTTSPPIVLSAPRTGGPAGPSSWSPYSVTWSPDGTQLLYLGFGGTRDGIVAVPVDGEGPPVLLAEDDDLAAYTGAPWLTTQAWGRKVDE